MMRALVPVRTGLARSVSLALVIALVGCDVVVSVGDHDTAMNDAGALDGAAHDDAALDDAAPDAFVADAPGTDAPPECHAADAGACAACEAMRCCAELTACAAHPLCLCLTDCALAGNSEADCATHCGGTDGGEHAALAACARGACSGACP